MSKLVAVEWAFIVVLGVSLVAGQECLEPQGRWADGPVRSVDAEGHVVVAGRGSTLTVVDATDPSALQEVGRLQLGGVADDVAFSGDLAFVAADRHGLVIVDVSDPSQPLELGHYPTDSPAEGVAVTGSIAYLVDRWDGLHVLNVTDPTNPTLLGFLEGSGYPEGVAVSGDLVLIAAGSAGLVLVDVSVPSEPTQLAIIDLPGPAFQVTPAGDLALVACYTAGLVAVNISDPTDPYEVSTWDEANYVFDVTLWGNFALLASSYSGMYVVDYSAPVNITTVGQYSTGGVSMQVAEVGDVAYVADGDGGLLSVSLTNPTEPEDLGWLPTAGSTYGVTAIESTAYVSDSQGVIRVMDAADPTSLAEVASVSLRTTVYSLVVEGDTGYANTAVGLTTLDMTDPLAPVELTRFGTDGQLNAVAVSGTVAYLAENDWQNQRGALRLVDVTDPASPVELAVLQTASEAEGVAVSGGMAYVTTNDHGLRVVDVSDPTAPAEVGSLEEPSQMVGIEVSGPYAYVGAHYAGLLVIDIADPTSPVELARVGAPGGAGDVLVDGNLVFVEQSYSGVFAVDVSEPSLPVVLASWEGVHDARQLSLAEGRLFVAESAAGLAMLDAGACAGGEPLVAAFEWEPAAPTVGAEVQFTDTSIGSPSSWTWDFGDGGTSSLQSPTYVFQRAGPTTVALTVGSDGVTDTVSQVIQVQGVTPPITDPGEHVYVVPAAASSPGLAGTSWVSDLVVNVPGNADAAVDLFFMPSGQDNSGSVGHRILVPAGQSLKLQDVVQSLFLMSEVSGAILVGSDQELVVASRTFNDASSGTYGQFIAGYPLMDAISGTERAAVIQLTRNDDYRTNIGLANVTGRQLDVTIGVYESSGALIGARDLGVPPYGYLQESDILGQMSSAPVADAMAMVTSEDEDAQYFCYASVVDNISGDPVYISASRSAGDPFTVPAAAHVEGANNTSWRTDVEILKPGLVPANITVELLAADTDNTAPESRQVLVAAGTSMRLRDVIGDLFGTSGSAALRVTTEVGAMMVTSRTYNDLGDRTFGQYIPGLPDSEAVEHGDEVRLVLLSSSIDSSVGFRTNIGAVNASAIPMMVRLNLFQGNGNYLGNLTMELEPYEFHQANDVYRHWGEDVDDGYVEVFTDTEDARFFVYASVVDNRSGDPIYVPPR